MKTRPIVIGQALRGELEAIASEELKGPLYFAQDLREASPEDRERLRAYLAAELQDGGTLSVSHAKESGNTPVGQIRIQAKRLLEKLSR